MTPPVSRLALALAILFTVPTAVAQTGTIVGTVIDANGTPLPGVNARVDNTTLGAASDADGAFRIVGVPSGPQTVLVTLLGYIRVEREVTVPAGSEVRVDLTLTADALRLSEVAVTASRREEDLSQVPRAVDVVPQEVVELYTEQTSDLSATLGKFVPNFTSPSVGNDVFLATLRGRAPLYLVDGVPLQSNEGLRGAVLGNLDPFMLERIEVLYGASTIYGGGAPGGVIQFFTKDPSAEPLDVDVQLFARNYLVDGTILDGDALDIRTATNVSGTQGAFQYLLSGTFETTNGAFRPDGERIAPIGTSDYDDYSLFGKLRYELGSSQSVQVTASRSYREPNNSFFGVQVLDDDLLADPDRSAAVALPVETAFTYDNPVSQTYYSFNGQYENSALAGGSLRIQGYYFDTNFQQGGADIRGLLTRNGGTFPDEWPGLFQTSSDANQGGARAEYVRPVGDQVLVTIGGDVLQANDSTPVTLSAEGPFDAENRFDGSGGIQDQGAPTELFQAGAFVQTDVDATERLRLSGGARFDYITFDVLPFTPTFTRVEPGVQRPGGSGTNSGLSVNLGAAFEAIDNTTVYANFSQGFSLPSLAFLVVNIDPGVPIEGDEIVSPQIVNSVDLGVRGQLGSTFAYGLAGFYAFSEDASQIQFDTATGQGSRVQAPQRNYGFEATVEAAPADGFRIGADVSITETDVDPQDDGSFQPASSIEVIPLTTAIRASYAIPSVKGLAFNAEVFTINNRDRAFNFLLDNDGDGEPDVDEEGVPARADAYSLRGYTTLDLGASYQIPPSALGGVGGRLGVQVLNLLNETFIPTISQRQVGPIFSSRRRNGLGRNVTVTLSLDI
ncbi:MAG: TonB-dependent receptor [Bacteroidota bacterium]